MATKQDHYGRVIFPDFALSASVEADLSRRKQREALFGSEFAGNVAWTILLELYAAELKAISIRYGQLALSTTCPMSVHYRWFKVLEERELVTAPDSSDVVRLTTFGLRQMDEFYGRNSLKEVP